MKNIIIYVLIVVITGCVSFGAAYLLNGGSKPETEEEIRNTHRLRQTKKSEWLAEHSTYIVDKRTNMCFLLVEYTNRISITQVPCSPDVEDIIEGRK